MSEQISDSKTIALAAKDALDEFFPGNSVDWLLIHPNAAIRVCKTVRANLGKRLEDEIILQAFLNGRKRGFFSTKRRSGK